MNPRIMILISVIALLCMFFFGVNLFLQGKGIMFLLIPIAMAIFIFMAISTVPGNDEPQIFRSEPVCLPAAGRLRRTGAAAGSRTGVCPSPAGRNAFNALRGGLPSDQRPSHSRYRLSCRRV